MKIYFSSNKKIPKKNLLLRFSQAVCRQLPALEKDGEICVVFVSDQQIKDINKRFLNSNRTTDVIAFNYEEIFNPNYLQALSSPSVKSGLKKEIPFGDIYISLDTAKRQAKQGGHLVLKECALLILHGLLHLVGFEDKTLKKRKLMFALQKKIFLKIFPNLAPPDILL